MVISLSTIKFVKLDTKEMEWNNYPTGRVEKRQKWKNASITDRKGKLRTKEIKKPRDALKNRWARKAENGYKVTKKMNSNNEFMQKELGKRDCETKRTLEKQIKNQPFDIKRW